LTAAARPSPQRIGGAVDVGGEGRCAAEWIEFVPRQVVRRERAGEGRRAVQDGALGDWVLVGRVLGARGPDNSGGTCVAAAEARAHDEKEAHQQAQAEEV